MDNNRCKVTSDRKLTKQIYNYLSYEKVWFKQGQYSKIKKSRLASFLDAKSGFFLAGFLSDIKNRYKLKDKDIEGSFSLLPQADKIFEVKDITFRDDQEQAIDIAATKQRGVILHATGTGKTVVVAGIIARFYNNGSKFLFLAHTKEIISQTYERFLEYGFNVGILSGDKDKKENLDAQVLVAVINSYVNYVSEKNFDYDGIFIDECHHANDVNSRYGKLLLAIDINFKIGLTGTLPVKKEQKLSVR
ncbi:MAG: DEAD/DEAH box helicase family protein [Promethearchaeota archaeon]